MLIHVSNLSIDMTLLVRGWREAKSRVSSAMDCFRESNHVSNERTVIS